MTSPEQPPIATARLASGVLFLDEAGRIMLVRPTYKEFWDIPGGYVEPGESPRAACIREIHEELGLDVEVGPLLVVDWAPYENEGDKILYVFAGGVLGVDDLRTVRLLDGEISEFRYLELAQLGNFAPSRLVRRLHTAAIALSETRTTYAEHGIEICTKSVGQ